MNEPAQGLALSDRLNAVLVRDVQQMLNGRAFIAVLVLSLLAVLVLAALISSAPDGESGRDAFQAVIVALAPLLTLVVPMQAFFSARQEIGGGASELLLLSNLTPARIVWGKLLSALVQIVLWTSVFAPVVAFTFVLRGISVVQIGAALVLVMLFGLTMSAAGIACGTLTVWRRVSQLVNALSLLAMAGGTFFFTGFLAFGMSDFMGVRFLGEAFAWISFSCLLGLGLLVMIACSQFTHPYENRSTGFRAFLLIASLVALVVTLLLVSRSSWYDALPTLAATLLGFGALFFIFAATEEAALSPRVRAQVPARRGIALLLAPLLPGQGRGLLYALIMVALLLGISKLGIELGGGRSDVEIVDGARLLALYGLFYASVAASIRRRLGEGTARNWIARLLVLIVFVLGCAVPMLIQALAGMHGWTPLQILNPFWTIGDQHDAQGALILLGLMTGAAMFFQLAPMFAGLREVAAASRRRDGNADAG